MAIIRGAGCLGCHKVGSEGGPVGPDLTRIGARLSSAQLREAVLEPDAKIAKGYEKFAGVMPKNFGTQLTAAQFESLIRFLASRK
jgi:putative heme-binding domain-containing protein